MRQEFQSPASQQNSDGANSYPPWEELLHGPGGNFKGNQGHTEEVLSSTRCNGDNGGKQLFWLLLQELGT